MQQNKIEFLEEKAKQVRADIICSLASANSGHTGGSLSATDILVALYFEVMNVRPDQPKWPDRDRLVLSKGHAAPALYAVLAHKGYFSRDHLWTLRQVGSILQGHPDMKRTPGVDMSTGSLGQGISAANGMALAGKIDKKDYRVYALLGDGELEEGEVWEAAMTAAHYKLDNLTAFVDHNHLQIDGFVTDVKSPEPVDEKFKAFGWNVLYINGHDMNEILEAVEQAKATKGKPTVIIAETVKGKGVSFMECQAGWHGIAPNAQQKEQALKELGAEINV
ncbi:transketolase [Mahella sp.]|uniref:transketolase n=1 Tax=Mahella sp. TaxID=2798721 RepID=UPI0025C6F255|nr:transketolase [Mahella sp.]MBZ4666016.1 transketolase subunit [Mahella sp.]